MTSVCNGSMPLSAAHGGPPVLKAPARRARRAAEDALRDSERRHRIALQHLPGTSVGLYDLELRCLLLEGPHLERAGIDGAAMVGRHVSEIVQPELLAATEQIVATRSPARTAASRSSPR